MIRLSPRLAAVASLLDGGGTLADIGTDHAYLPVALLQNGVIKRAVACDIGEGPLNNAKNTAAAANGQLDIDFRISDGLDAVDPKEADEIVICGMGGNLIERILLNAPWVCSAGIHLVLQPMTHAEDVRRYLCGHGFRIEKELCSRDGGKVYLSISARYTGDVRYASEGYYIFGALPKTDAPSLSWAKKQYDRIVKRHDSLLKAGRGTEEAMLLRDAINYYRENQHENT